MEISRRTVSYGAGDSGWAPITKARGSRPPRPMGSGVHTNGSDPQRIRLMIYAQDGLRRIVPEARLVLGLRDIIDAPEVVRRRWQVEGAYEAIQRFYDLVLVYGSRDVFDLADQYRLPEGVARKVRYCGYLCTPALPRYPERIRAQYANGAKAGTKLVVAMAGGGADAYPMMRAVLDALPALQARERLALVMIVGPFMSSEIGRAHV